MGTVEHFIKSVGSSEIVWRKFRGDVSADDIMDSFVYIINNGMISERCMGIVTDLRDSRLNLDKESFKNLIVFINSSPRLTKLRIAVIVDTSEKIVFPMMAASQSDIMVQPFSTEEAAETWILG